MDLKTVMAELEACGTEQNRKIYARHGAKPPLFGVSFKDQDRLAKKYRDAAQLAVPLWDTRNFDARILASKIADAPSLPAATLEKWSREVDAYPCGDALARLVADHPQGRALAERWALSPAEGVQATGWSVLACLADQSGVFTEKDILAWVARAERGLHEAPNRARLARVMALIRFGLHGPEAETAVRAAATRIGHVQVDHGQTSCTTPLIVPYMEKTLAHRRAKGTGRKAPAGKGSVPVRTKPAPQKPSVRAAAKKAAPAAKRKSTSPKSRKGRK